MNTGFVLASVCLLLSLDLGAELAPAWSLAALSSFCRRIISKDL